jgi:hypothetical protein
LLHRLRPIRLVRFQQFFRFYRYVEVSGQEYPAAQPQPAHCGDVEERDADDFTLNGKTVRPLGRGSDKALALLQSLDEKQRKQAVLNYNVVDSVLGPGPGR